MANDSYILFNKSLEQCRRLGACGGRAHARNCRLRRLALALPAQTISSADPQPETAAEAIAILDTQFPWLRGAENRKAARHVVK